MGISQEEADAISAPSAAPVGTAATICSGRSVGQLRAMSSRPGAPDRATREKGLSRRSLEAPNDRTPLRTFRMATVAGADRRLRQWLCRKHMVKIRLCTSRRSGARPPRTNAGMRTDEIRTSGLMSAGANGPTRKRRNSHRTLSARAHAIRAKQGRAAGKPAAARTERKRKEERYAGCRQPELRGGRRRGARRRQNMTSHDRT